jgi:hypothetical protein
MTETGALLAGAMLRLFPESRDFNSDDLDLPYMLMRNLVWFLESQAKPGLPDVLINRILEFNEWCLSQPSTSSAETDILTILTVSFYEPIIGSATLCFLVPKLIPKPDFIRSREYFLAWVGSEHYERALALYS